MNPHPAAAGHATTAAGATVRDVRPDDMLRLLSQICRRTNLRIDMYQRGIAVADARGDRGYACAFKHLTHIDKQDRKVLEGLIDRLQR
jgi:hypothetical protein